LWRQIRAAQLINTPLLARQLPTASQLRNLMQPLVIQIMWPTSSKHSCHTKLLPAASPEPSTGQTADSQARTHARSVNQAFSRFQRRIHDRTAVQSLNATTHLKLP
jgi:hypothetical protein